MRAYEVKRGDVNQVWEEICRMYDRCYTYKDLNNTYKKAYEMLESVPKVKVPDEEKIKIGIVGEIYVIMESSVNMGIEQILNNMGIEVENAQYISDWVNHNIRPRFLDSSSSHKAIKKAKRFVKMNCGGHDMENIGRMIDYKERGFDGVIHLMPFACLPELITQSIIPTISKELELPILSLSLDEQMGMANNQTRIEAFVDLIRSKKKAYLKVGQSGSEKDGKWNYKQVKHELAG